MPQPIAPRLLKISVSTIYRNFSETFSIVKEPDKSVTYEPSILKLLPDIILYNPLMSNTPSFSVRACSSENKLPNPVGSPKYFSTVVLKSLYNVLIFPMVKIFSCVIDSNSSVVV